MSEEPRRVPPEALVELQNGNKIAAIKITRERTGLGLKEAKDLIEAHVARDPVLRESLRSQASGVLSWILMVILVVAAIVYFFPR